MEYCSKVNTEGLDYENTMSCRCDDMKICIFWHNVRPINERDGGRMAKVNGYFLEERRSIGAGRCNGG